MILLYSLPATLPHPEESPFPEILYPCIFYICKTDQDTYLCLLIYYLHQYPGFLLLSLPLLSAIQRIQHFKYASCGHLSLCFCVGRMFHSQSFTPPQRAQVTSLALPSVAHTVCLLDSSWLTPCCCCSWWSSYCTGISKTLGSSALPGLLLNQQSFLASHSAKLQLLSVTLSCLQSQDHPGDSYVLSLLTASMRCNINYLWNIASLCSQETVPR